MNTSELVQPRHLNRTAEIYVRQSSPNQVVTNKESQRMQYALRERATSLGWNQHGIHIIDDDLGRSGATTEGREGVYDPTSINGRLLLGLKGQISELELHTIRARLPALQFPTLIHNKPRWTLFYQ